MLANIRTDLSVFFALACAAHQPDDREGRGCSHGSS
jgi:hypothetical protein